MKLSNSAITMLMAAYRAIFKNAYYKGLVGAIAVSASLGVASEPMAQNAPTGLDQISGDGHIVTGEASPTAPKYTKLEVTEAVENKNDFTLTIAGSNTANANKIEGAVFTATKGNFVIDDSERAQGVNNAAALDIKAASSDASLIANSVHVKRGTLNISGTDSHKATLDAKTITIGDSGASSKANTATSGTIILGDKAVLGEALTDGGDVSKLATINLNKNGNINLGAAEGTGAASTINAAILNINGGTLTTTGEPASRQSEPTISKGTINFGEGAMTGGTITVKAGDSLTFSSVSLKKDENTKTSETFKISSGTLSIGGALNLESGTFVVEPGATVLSSEASSGTDKTDLIKVGDSGTGNVATATLKIDSKTLKTYLSGDNTHGKGSVTLNKESQLHLTDSNAIDLGGLNISSGDSVVNGGINVVASATAASIKAKEFTLNKAFASQELDNLTVIADKLTLDGKNDAQGVVGGLKTTQIKDLAFTNGAKLKGTVVLTSTTPKAKSTEEVSASGSITGLAAIGSGADNTGTLQIKNGDYTLNDGLTLNSGTLIVGSSGAGSATTTGASLVINGDVTFTKDKANTISVSGNAQTQAAILDLTGANIKPIADDNSAAQEIKASGFANVKMNADAIKTFLTTGGDSHKGQITLGANSTLDAGDNSLELDVANLGSESGSGKLAFTDSGTLIVNSLSVSGATSSSGLDIDSGTIVTNTLTVKDTGNAKTFKIAGGTYEINSGFTNANYDQSITLEGGTVNLGSFERDDNNYYEGGFYIPLTKGGNVSNLSIGAGKVTVQLGTWSGGDVSLSGAGSFTVGKMTEDGKYITDLNDELIAATFNGKALSLATGAGTVEVISGSTANFNTLDASGGTITVDGNLTINGKYTPTKSEGTASYGVAFADNVVTVEKYGTLTFGEDATKAITLESGGDAVVIAPNTFGTITLNGGEVKLSFTDNKTVFTKDGIIDLRKDLFGKESGEFLNGRVNIGAAQIKGLSTAVSNGTVAWESIKDYKDIIASFVQDDLSGATVTGIKNNETVIGHYGALRTDASNTSDTVTIDGYSSLNKADANGVFVANSEGKILNVNVKPNARFVLANGGKIGNITLNQNSDDDDSEALLTILSNGHNTTVGVISGSGSIDIATAGSVTAQSINISGDLYNAIGAPLEVTKDLTVSGESYFDSDVTVGGKAHFKGEVSFGGVTTITHLVTDAFAGAYTGLTVTSGAVFNHNFQVGEGATFTADKVKLTGQDNALRVGEDYIEPGNTDYTTTTGYAEIGNLELGKNRLVVDPDYSQATSIAAIKHLGPEKDNAKNTLEGEIILAQNSALSIGANASKAQAQEFLKNFTTTSSLHADGVGAVFMLDSKLEVKNDASIQMVPRYAYHDICDLGETSCRIKEDYAKVIDDADLFLGDGAVLALLNGAFAAEGDADKKGSIHFNKSGAQIRAQEGSKIILDGDKYLNSRNINLFTGVDSANNIVNNVYLTLVDENGQDITADDTKLRVESLNGLMYFDLTNGEVKPHTLKADITELKKSFTQASASTQELLRVYAARNLDWSNPIPKSQDTLVGANVTSDWGKLENGTFTVDKTLEDKYKKKIADGSLQVIYKDNERANGNREVIGVFEAAHNIFLEEVVRNSSKTGLEADKVAHLGVFAGTAQAALAAGKTTSDAIASRLGGASVSAVNAATNGQGSALWVSPVYRSMSSDGFNVDGANYGVDVDLFGVALGGDYTLANGFKFGAMFNVGSGDVDGNQNAQGVKNDFDYYGFSIYGGYSVDKFSIMADIGYTNVDNDMSVNVLGDKAQATADSTNLSLGVTGKYEFDFNGLSVTPHAGLRYSIVDLDDYNIKFANENIAQYKGDKLNVFSIPVGVTFAKSFVSTDWTIKPSLDLTLTANFGDDEVEDSVNWGFSNYENTQVSEIMDNFTYGATAGVEMSNGSFSLGGGVNYTGSSNVSEYGINLNARFVF